MQNNFRLTLLASAIAVAATTSASATSVGTDAFVPLAHAQHASVLHNGELVTGPVASSQPMHVSVSLKLQNQDKLNAFLATAAKPGTPVAQRSMTGAQFLAQYSPTQAQAQAVANYLNKAGFKNVTIAANRQLVTANASADTVRTAFHTSFESARTTDGRVGYHNTAEVMVPASLKETVLAVIGMDTVHISHTFAKKAAAGVPGGLPYGASNNFLTTTPVGHDPAEFATIYGADSLGAASTVAVGIITEGDMKNVVSDLKMYTDAHHLDTVNASTVTVDGGSADITGDIEWDLDSQDIIGMTGGVQEMVFYATTDLTDAAITDDYNAAVTANHVAVINVSLGECETGTQTSGVAAAEDQIFEQAVAQGQTFSVSSGDSGANECSPSPAQETEGLDPGIIPSWPASSQYVVSVGGTEVYTGTAANPADTKTWLSEIVWNNKSEAGGAGGGSPSTFEAMPSWQINVGKNVGSVMRGVPDISFDGSPDSGSVIWSDGVAGSQVGGTSLSSPLFVGAWARTIANNTATAVRFSGGPLQLGFAAPLIYKLPALAFHDITVGDNDGETSAPGWDYTTGFGSPIVSAMAYYSVTHNGGTPTVTITGKKATDPTAMGLAWTFTDHSTDTGGSISTHYWYFGADRTGSYETNPVHTFQASGTYFVTETVTDSANHTTATSAPLKVIVTATTDTVTNKVPPAPPAPPVPTPPAPVPPLPTPPTPPAPVPPLPI